MALIRSPCRMKLSSIRRSKARGSIVLFTFLCTIMLIPYSVPAGIRRARPPGISAECALLPLAARPGKDQGSVFRPGLGDRSEYTGLEPILNE